MKENRKRGFAAMDPEKQRAISAKGGRSVPPEKRAFSKSLSLAAEAGRKGGAALAPSKRAYAKDPALAAESARKGGLASSATKRAKRDATK